MANQRRDVVHDGHSHNHSGRSGHGDKGNHESKRAQEHKGHGGHGDHGGHAGHEEMFRKRFWISLLLSIPVMLYSPALQEWLSFSMPAFPGSGWITPLFSATVFAYGGIPFLKMAWPELRKGKPGMMTLISLVIVVAFAYSIATLVLPTGSAFFWELVTLIVIMLLGHWIEMRSVRQASRALDELAELMPDTAERLLPDPWYAVTDTLQVGHVVEGTVTSVVDFGVFVDLGQGVEGLVHISETLASETTLKELEPGSPIAVRVLEIDHDRRRISLSLRGVAQDLSPCVPSAVWEEGDKPVGSQDWDRQPQAQGERLQQERSSSG
jgi:hypothetical protein